MSKNEKVKEVTLRRVAARRGLVIVKSKTRDKRAKDYNKYALVPEEAITYELTLEELESQLS